jgi:hypothetical protein
MRLKKHRDHAAQLQFERTRCHRRYRARRRAPLNKSLEGNDLPRPFTANL